MATKETTDLCGTRRRGNAPLAGSVWESRMKLDEFKGGIKVFNNKIEQNDDTETAVIELDKEVTPKQSPVKRKTWKTESLEKSPVQIAKLRSELGKKLSEESDSADGVGKKSPAQVKKTRSVNRSVDGDEKSSVQLRKLKSDELKCDGDLKNCDDGKRIEMSPAGIKISRSDQDCEKFGLCEEKGITSSLENVGEIKAQFDDNCVDDEDEELDSAKEIKDISVQELRKPSKTVIEAKKLLGSNERSAPLSQKKAPQAVNHAKIHPNHTKTEPVSENFHGVPRTHSRLQNLIDMIMWRDVSKSAFVFGIGTFVIISSSYTKDLNISFISVLAYLGLVYLAAIFLFRSFTNRGSIATENGDQDYVVREEEAIWLIKLVLPYINEFLLNLRALFSGDPATTMKLAVLLFVLARCGSSITIWKMAKLGFFVVFTVPKVCSSYSSQLTAFGTFWIKRSRDAWESCSHKKAVGFAIFMLIWNFSSLVARIWEVFMLFAALKYYQQHMTEEGWTQEEIKTANSSWQPELNTGGHRQGRRSTVTEIRKQNKVC